MSITAPRPKPARIGPYSRMLTNGAGEGLNGRSREGKYVRRCEAELLAQLSREPSFPQRLLCRRINKMMLVAEKLDHKIIDGSAWTPHDARTFGALNTAITRALRDLGLKSAPKDKAASLADIVAEHKRGAPSP